jgi:hypothetical protein
MRRLFPGLVVASVLAILFWTMQASAQMPQPAGAPKPRVASEVYKNLQVLADVPADLWFPTMSFIADSLGVNCNHCHADPFESDAKPAKRKARQMIAMVRELNLKYFAGASVVTCNSCHRGSLKPAGTPAPNLDHWLQFSRAREPLPAAAELISRYQHLVGAPAKLDARRQAISVRTSTYLSDGSVKNVESEIVLGDGEHAHVRSRREGGTATYIRSGDTGWADEGSGWRVLAQGEFHSLVNDLAALGLDEAEETSDAVTIGRERVYESDAYVVEVRVAGMPTWLFFDSTSGLLVRRRGFLPSYFGDHTWDVEYAQYAHYGKLMLPTTVRVINPAGSGLTTRTITARKLDARVDGKLFLDPLTRKESK